PIMDTIARDRHGLHHAITIMPDARERGNGRAESLTSLAENAMYRFKTLTGNCLWARRAVSGKFSTPNGESFATDWRA
ncbi:hypothetical protein, partial [Burkholderia ambifaria]|uniref:hypothetical protein n=1 Tax=Burkholderia ambifaria TaxID=152480 RepID=UPI001ABA1FFC